MTFTEMFIILGAFVVFVAIVAGLLAVIIWLCGGFK